MPTIRHLHFLSPVHHSAVSVSIRASNIPGEHCAKPSKLIAFNPKLLEFLHLAISEVTGPAVISDTPALKFVIVRERVCTNNGQNCKRLAKLLWYKEYEQRKYTD
jgi:hypothetical protein